jgi:hypothetical protein
MQAACSSRKWWMAIVVAALAGWMLVERYAPVHAAPGRPAAGEAGATTQRDQVDLAVTVYNSNVALVRDVRQISLPKGEFQLRFEDVAAAINPATVHFRSLSEPEHLAVVEQNYEYDLLDPQKLLQKYVGREVTLVRPIKESGSTKYEEVKATLLADNGAPVWKVGNEIVTGMAADSYRFPELPGNLYNRPTLLWTLDNSGAGKQKVEASYLTGEMNWSADYVLTVGRDEQAADLDGWVTLVNNSGAAYRDARLQLVAGELHRVEPNMSAMESDRMAVAKAAAAPQFAQEAFSEYHLYTLGRRTSIQERESKQLSLLTATAIPVQKKFVTEGQSYYYRSQQGIGNPMSQPVMVTYNFRNDEKSGLGMPLPAGTVRVYQADSRGSLQFTGEDHIKHTPKDENVQVYIGNAFDIVCERKQTDFRRLSDRLYEMAYEITLRNHKDAAVSVTVKEPLGGDWEVQDSNYKWTKLDAFSLGFDVPVDKDGTAVLKYRVRVRW